MSLTYRIHPEHRVLLVRGEGVITQQERLDALRAWTRDAAYWTCTDALCDFSAARSIPRLSDLYELIRVMREDRSGRGPSRLAMVTATPIAYGVARVFGDLVHLGGFDLRVRPFRHRDTAWAWLRPGGDRARLSSLPFE